MEIGKRLVRLRYAALVFFGMSVFLFSVLGSAYADITGEGSLSTCPGVWDGDPVVRVKAGRVQGFEDSSGTLAWKAIPYAAPPVGDLRWKQPEDPDHWTGVRAETDFCDVCPQLAASGVVGKEDCLYLNIWRPDSVERDLPVFVYIHGGGNSLGSAAPAKFHGANFAHRNNVVYVSINYRLGPMGWFTLPALRSDKGECAPWDWMCRITALDDAKNNSGNYGTLDIIQALRWVHRNIKAFGGDKHNVTIAGESAGAHNVVSLLLSPLARGLFDRAVAMSTPNPPGTSMAIADQSATQTLARLMVSDGMAGSEEEAYTIIDSSMTDEDIEAYLRSKTAEELILTYDRLAFTMLDIPNMFTDGTVIVEEGSQAFEDGAYPNKVPLIIGTTKDEMKMFMAGSFGTIEDYFQALDFPEGEGYAMATGYNTDLWKAKGTDWIARAMAAQPDQPGVFVYKFLWGANPEVVDPNLAFLFGSHHARDVEFFLDNPDTVGPGFGIVMNTEANRPGREAMTTAILGYLGNFMRTGDPNGDDLPPWPAWSNTDGEPKYITVDADLNDVLTGMSTEELDEDEILEDMMFLLGPEVTDFIISFNLF